MSNDPEQQVISGFVEHVRTVHFALLATCLALFAASLPEAPEDLRIAKRDLERIQTAANSSALEKLTNRGFLLAARGPGQWKAKPAGTYGLRLTYATKGARFSVVATPAWSTTLTLEEQAIPGISAESGLVGTCGNVVVANTNIGAFGVDISERSSLAEFSAFWDCLPQIRAVSFGQIYYHKPAPVSLGKEMAATFKNNLIEVTPLMAVGTMPFETIAPAPFPALFLTLAKGQLVLEFDPNKHFPVSPADFGATPVKYVIGLAPVSPAIGASGTIFTMPFTITADTRAVSTKAQQLLIDEYFPGTATGTFERRFPQLSLWAHGREARTPKILLEDLQTDIDRASESFELFGVKIPLSLIAKLGLLVLIAIEAYFCLHLSRLTLLVKGPSSVPSFPWIGAYLDLISRTASLTSAALLPVAVVAWLAISTWRQLGAATTILLGGIYVVVQCILIILMLRFWRAIERAQSVAVYRKVKVPVRWKRRTPPQ
jgi:hypothetical protein